MGNSLVEYNHNDTVLSEYSLPITVQDPKLSHFFQKKNFKKL